MFWFFWGAVISIFWSDRHRVDEVDGVETVIRGHSLQAVRRSNRPQRSRRHLTAALVGLLSVVFATPAKAQTTTTFVSNLDQLSSLHESDFGPHSGNGILCHPGVNCVWIAQQFTTGSNASGYALAEVLVAIIDWDADARAQFAIHQSTTSEEDSDLEVPGNKVVDLRGTLRRGEVSFAPARSTTLAAETDYFIVMKSSGGMDAATPTGIITILETPEEDEDTGASPGWSIADDHVYVDEFVDNGNPQDLLYAQKIAIKGRVGSSGSIITLVSNLDQPLDRIEEQINGGNIYSYSDLVQQFTTGSHAGGYRLSEVTVNLHRGNADANPSIAVHCSRLVSGARLPDDAEELKLGAPGEKLVDLTGSVARFGDQAFTPQSTTTLLPSTKYYLVMGGAETITMRMSSTKPGPPMWTTARRAGWEIADMKLIQRRPPEDFDYWGHGGFPARIAVKGTTRSGTVNTRPTSSNATVTMLEDAAEGYDDRWFEFEDFPFTDPDMCHELSGVKLMTVTTVGQLLGDFSGRSYIDQELLGMVIPGFEFYLDKGLALAFFPERNGNGSPYASFTFKVSDGVQESSSTHTMTINVTPVNDDATGTPSIAGASVVGETLTAEIGTVADVDGLPSTFRYQWVRVDGNTETDIPSAESRTYTLAPGDLGKTVKVKLGSRTMTARTRNSRATLIPPRGRS